MKTLLILRHAKAEESNPGGDRLRNLTGRGRHNAERMGEELLARKAVPDLIVSSDAARAVQTAELAAEAAGYDRDIHIEPGIYYSGGLNGLLKSIRRCSDAHASVMVVGHNPTLEELAAALTDPQGTEGVDTVLPTAGLFCIELEIDSWKDLKSGVGKPLWKVTPKSLEGGD